MKRNVTILVITKTEGSGARTVANELVSQYGYILYSMRDHLRRKYKKIYQTPSLHQEELKVFANQIRKEEGVEAIIAPILKKIRRNKKGNSFIVESLLCPGEIDWIMERCKKYDIDATLIAIDAPKEMRFERLRKRRFLKGARSLEKLKGTDEYLQKIKPFYMPVIIEQMIHTEEFEKFEKDPFKVNVPQCLLKVHPEAVFQNVDGKLVCTAKKIHEFVLG